MADDAVRLRIALAQVNPTVGDIEGNAKLISTWIDRAQEAGAQLVVFPEQTVTGYPAEDLWLKPHFLEAAREAVDEIASGVGAIAALVGFPEHDVGHLQLRRRARGRAGPRRLPQDPASRTTASSTSAATSSRATPPP